jgi:hypothetical protein
MRAIKCRMHFGTAGRKVTRYCAVVIMPARVSRYINTEPVQCRRQAKHA